MTNSIDFNNIKCVIFDLDGTIYFGNTLAQKANEVIEKARQLFKNIFFITNNSNQSRKQVYERLTNLEVNANLEEVINTSYAMAKYLKDNNFKEVFCLGTDALAVEISDFGIIPDSKNPQAIAIGYDLDFNMFKMEKALNVYNKNCKIIVASKEKTYPRTPEILSPGACAIAAAFEQTVNRTCDIVIGKPNTFMLDLMTRNLELKPKEILVIGDSYDIDIQLAKNYGANAILISTNEKPNDCMTVAELKEILDILENIDNKALV